MGINQTDPYNLKIIPLESVTTKVSNDMYFYNISHIKLLKLMTSIIENHA
jgi:hypothetical protein